MLARLEDSEGLGSCAKGLIALEERGKWDSERAKKIVETYAYPSVGCRLVSCLSVQAPRTHPPPQPVPAAERTIPRLTAYRHIDGEI